MNAKSSVIAQKLLNMYRQAHVILGGWAALNPIFLAEADSDVMDAMRQLPTGRMLARHIENLRSGKTPMDSIERDLLPYGGMMSYEHASVTLTDAEMAGLVGAINAFSPDINGLNAIKSMDVVRRFGDEWIPAIRTALATAHPDLLDAWNRIVTTDRAYSVWSAANEILTQPLSDRARAQVQADIPEYETYLPMFGDAGNALLGRLRNFLSTVHPADNDAH